MTHRRPLIAALLALVLAAGSASAQSPSRDTPATSAPTLPRTRHGFFASLGFGYGNAGFNCAQCSSGRGNGVSGILRLGGTLSPHLRLGVESTGWYKNAYGVEADIELLSAVLYYYPSRTSNLWLKGGLGYAHSHAEGPADDISQDGAGIDVGVGYDLPLGGSNVVLVPFASYVRQVSGKIDYNGSHTNDSSNANVFQLGLSLGFRH